MAAGPVLFLGPSPGALVPGIEVLVRYDDPSPEWHVRLLLSCVVETTWIVMSPDGDIFAEDISAGNPDLQGWRLRPADRSVPFGILANQIYDFHPRVMAPQLAQLLIEGAAHADSERILRGVAPPLPVLAPAPPAAGLGPAAAAAAGAALVAAALPPPAPAFGLAPLAGAIGGAAGGIGGYVGGVGAGLAGLAAAIGGGAALPAAGAAASGSEDDARTLPITRDHDGKRFKEFREGALACKTCDFDDWPVEGPRTLKWVLGFILENGTTPMGMHQAWRTNCRMQPGDGPVVEHEGWCRVLQLLISYDQLDGANLAACELIGRNIQRIQEKHKEKLISSSGDDGMGGETSLFMGMTHGSRAGLCVSPALQQWMGKQLQEEAILTKERRKAREERALARIPAPKRNAKGGTGAAD